MKLPNITGLVKVGRAFVQANRPEILFGASIAATLGSVVLAAKGGYEAGQKVMKAEYPHLDLTLETQVPLTVKEKTSLTWLCYMPAAITTVTAVGSTTGLHIVHIKEKKALAQTALAALEEVKESAKQFEKENLGILKDEEKSKILEERADPDGVAHVQNSDGEISELFLVRDPVTGRDIWTNRARIEEAIVEVGNCVNGSDEASLNNFFEQAGYGRVDIGDQLGWSGVIPSISWNDLNGQPISGVRDDGRPFRGFRFLPDPEKGFDDNHR